ncbi:hypothetical protein CSE45_1202 [Citreicella sp. SE45]|nr:hypothetical protein CSE45_1202 [Citreicella sp. SE45]
MFLPKNNGRHGRLRASMFAVCASCFNALQQVGSTLRARKLRSLLQIVTRCFATS